MTAVKMELPEDYVLFAYNADYGGFAGYPGDETDGSARGRASIACIKHFLEEKGPDETEPGVVYDYSTKLMGVPKNLLEFVTLDEYDGRESVVINYQTAIAVTVADKTLSDSEKVRFLKQILDVEFIPITSIDQFENHHLYKDFELNCETISFEK